MDETTRNRHKKNALIYTQIFNGVKYTPLLQHNTVKRHTDVHILHPLPQDVTSLEERNIQKLYSYI